LFVSFSAWLVDCRLTSPDSITKQSVLQTIERSLALFRTLTAENSKYVENPEISSQCAAIASKLSLIPWMYHIFDYQQIFTILIEHSGEPTSKTLLGNFQSPFLHSWDQVQSQWTKNNAHLAHTALILFQAIRHEIPTLRTTLERHQVKMQSIAAKALELSSSINIEKATYEALFEKHNIKAPSLDEVIATDALQQNIHRELSLVLASSLPSDAENLVNKLKSSTKLLQAIQYYDTWMKNINKSGSTIISSLQLVIDQGHQILLPKTLISTTISNEIKEEKSNDDDTIDWGDFEISDSTDVSSIKVVEDEENTKENNSIQLRQGVLEDVDVMLAFFRQRSQELSSKNEFLTLVMGRSIANLPESLRSFDTPEIVLTFVVALEEAKIAVHEFCRKISHLESDIRLNEVVATFIQKRSKILQLRQSLNVIESKRQETESLVLQSIAKIELAKQSIIHLKTKMESALSILTGGRVVNISVPNLNV
jgi:hypothetical protein